MLSAWVGLVVFTQLWLLSIFLLLVLEAEGTLTFDVADNITNVTLEVCLAAPRPAIPLNE